MTNNEILSGAASSIRANKNNSLIARQSEILNGEIYPKIRDNEKRFEESYSQKKAEFDERRATEQAEFEERRAKEQSEFDSSWEVARKKMEADNQELIAEGKARAEYEVNRQYETILTGLEKLLEV